MTTAAGRPSQRQLPRNQHFAMVRSISGLKLQNRSLRKLSSRLPRDTHRCNRQDSQSEYRAMTTFLTFLGAAFPKSCFGSLAAIKLTLARARIFS